MQPLPQLCVWGRGEGGGGKEDQLRGSDVVALSTTLKVGYAAKAVSCSGTQTARVDSCCIAGPNPEK